MFEKIVTVSWYFGVYIVIIANNEKQTVILCSLDTHPLPNLSEHTVKFLVVSANIW